MRTPRRVMEAIHFGRIRRRRLVELAPIVFRAASDGDDIAQSIVDRQADEVVAMAGAAITRLRLRDLEVDVVLGGGIFRTSYRDFFDRIRRGLLAVAPSARMITLGVPPVVGAALLGLDRLGAASDGARSVREHLTNERLESGLRMAPIGTNPLRSEGRLT